MLTIKLVSAEDFYKLLNAQKHKTGVPFADKDDTDWMHDTSRRGVYWIALNGKKLVAAFKFYKWSDVKDDLNHWLEKEGHQPIMGDIYQGAYIGVHPDYRRKGLGTQLNSTRLF